MRTRQRGLASYAFVKYSGTDQNGVPYPEVNVDYAPSVSLSNREVITDTVVKDFKRLQTQGRVFMNPVTMSREKIETDVQAWQVGPHPGWGTRNHTGTPLARWIESIDSAPPAWYTTRVADAQARTLLMAHSRVAAEDFMSLVSIKEMGKTVSMLAHPFEEARRLISRQYALQEKLRKTNVVRDARDHAKIFVSAWNEFRFGWKPVLHDIQGIYRAWLDNQEMEVRPYRKVARASDRDITWEGESSFVGAVPFASQLSVKAQFSKSAKVSSGVLYELYDDSLADATARRIGARLSDVPSTIWELVPYSFVVDRFIDIGTWLNAVVPKPGVRVLNSWTTVTQHTYNRYNVIDAYTNVYTPAGGSVNYPHHQGARLSATVDTMARTANPTIPPLPTVNYRDLNLVQHIDHAALITQRLLGLKRRS